MKQRWKVVIIGGGFGGLRAAQELKSAPVEVTLFDRRNYHLFQPLIYQVATGSLSPGEIAAPLRSILRRQQNTRVLLGEVVDIDPAAKEVLTADGCRFPYDSLMVAAGSKTSYYGHDSWQEWAPGLKGIEEATNVRHKILYAFEAAERILDPAERRAWLTFVIVGGGPTGVELAGAIAEIAQETLKSDFRSIIPGDARILLINGAPRLLSGFPEDLADKAQHLLEKLGVEVQSGVTVKDIDREGVAVEGQDGVYCVPAKTVIWAGGVVATDLAKTLVQRTGAQTGHGGKIKVSPDLTVPGYPDIYILGDLAHVQGENGSVLPGVAQVAIQEGAYAARAIVLKLRGGGAPQPFRYFDKGDLAVIGRAAAVARIFGLHLSGLVAWVIWVFVHLMYLVQFQSRVLVFIQWAFEFVTFSRGARLITGSAASDHDFSKELPSPKSRRIA